MLNLGINDYSVLEGRQRIGRIRFADERLPGAMNGARLSAPRLRKSGDREPRRRPT